MINISLRENIQLDEFRVEQDRKSGYKTCIILDIQKDKAKELKKMIQGDAATKSFGRFDFKGSIAFNINNFYIHLYNVELSSWSYGDATKQLKISFKPLDGFEYQSGMGKGVLRNEILKEIGI